MLDVLSPEMYATPLLAATTAGVGDGVGVVVTVLVPPPVPPVVGIVLPPPPPPLHAASAAAAQNALSAKPLRSQVSRSIASLPFYCFSKTKYCLAPCAVVQ